ncbi:hypothetical protein SBC2_28510 [Caballeronia sp. SBC2]|nr:hypothetical protein SBC2_28510 [Caballeronia sp. SBC2]
MPAARLALLRGGCHQEACDPRMSYSHRATLRDLLQEFRRYASGPKRIDIDPAVDPGRARGQHKFRSYPQVLPTFILQKSFVCRKYNLPALARDNNSGRGEHTTRVLKGHTGQVKVVPGWASSVRTGKFTQRETADEKQQLADACPLPRMFNPPQAGQPSPQFIQGPSVDSSTRTSPTLNTWPFGEFGPFTRTNETTRLFKLATPRFCNTSDADSISVPPL